MIRKADKELKEYWGWLFNTLPYDSKVALKDALMRLHHDAQDRAKLSWQKHKAPMALYWKVVSVYSGHLARSIYLK